MNDAKIIELMHLFDFLRAAEIQYDNIEPSERPDFIVKIGDRSIGIELTIAHHTSDKYTALQIEQAQGQYARDLRDAVEGASHEGYEGLILNISFEDGIAVTPEDYLSIQNLAKLIWQRSEALPNPGAITIWSEKWAHTLSEGSARKKRKEILSAPFPEFIQNITLYRDGKHDIKIAGGRGGITPAFDDATLLPILEKKNERMKGYEIFDENWLIIVTSARAIPGYNPPEERDNVLLSSFATTFGEISVTRPIPSKFDKTYLFKWPSRVTLL